MNPTEQHSLLTQPVDVLAGSIHSGEISARELVQASLDQIEAHNPTINAFVDVCSEEALQEADQIRSGDPRPFAGVPIAIKNNRAVKDMRLTLGSQFSADFTPNYDHNVVARLKKAGFIVVGTTTLPEWGILPVSEARRYGPTRNPHDHCRTPGGSSGGSAAAVAAAMVPIAHGNDGGGSTRIPASCCGLVGLKPQRGRISLAPEVGEHYLVCDGVLTRTVHETAMLLDVLAGPELGDSSWAPPPESPFYQQSEQVPQKQTIGFTTKPPLTDVHVDTACIAAVEEAAKHLEDLGHHVEEVDPPWQIPGIMELFSAAFGPAVSLQAAWMSMVHGREVTQDDVEPLSWYVWEQARALDGISVLGAGVQLQTLGRGIVQWAAAYDAILTPTLAQEPVKIGAIDSYEKDPADTFVKAGQFSPFTPICNLTGSPAISLPVTQSEIGLPVGVQLIGQPAQEGKLLALARQIMGETSL